MPQFLKHISTGVSTSLMKDQDNSSSHGRVKEKWTCRKFWSRQNESCKNSPWITWIFSVKGRHDVIFWMCVWALSGGTKDSCIRKQKIFKRYYNTIKDESLTALTLRSCFFPTVLPSEFCKSSIQLRCVFSPPTLDRLGEVLGYTFLTEVKIASLRMGGEAKNYHRYYNDLWSPKAKLYLINLFLSI